MHRWNRATHKNVLTGLLAWLHTVRGINTTSSVRCSIYSTEFRFFFCLVIRPFHSCCFGLAHSPGNAVLGGYVLFVLDDLGSSELTACACHAQNVAFTNFLAVFDLHSDFASRLVPIGCVCFFFCEYIFSVVCDSASTSSVWFVVAGVYLKHLRVWNLVFMNYY